MSKFSGIIKKIAIIRTNLGFIVAGILMVVFSIMGILAPERETITTEATIDKVIEMVSADEAGGNENRVIISFVDNKGVKHENIEFGYTTGMKEGDSVTIEYDAENPELVSSPNSGYIVYITLVIGIFGIGFGIFGSVNNLNKSVEEMNPYDRTYLSKEKVEPLTVEESAAYDAMPENEYYFHFTGKMNQSYIMETPERRPIYKANCDKVGVVSNPIFTFENCLTGESKTSTLTHLVTTSYSNISVSSSFKIDGKDCFDLLGEMGYSLEQHIHGLKLDFDVLKNGKKVGELKTASTNILKDGKDSKLADALGSRGLYKIYCKESDIEACFMAAFITSKVEYVL